MRNRNRSMRIALLAVATAAALIAVPSSAGAATTFIIDSRYVTHTDPVGCSTGLLCVYQHENWGGSKAQRSTTADGDWRNNTYANGAGLNDSATSVFNNSNTHSFRVFRDVGFGSHRLCLAPDTGVTDLRRVEWIEDQPWGPQLSNFSDRGSGHDAFAIAVNNLNCSWRAQ